ncbi:UDP-N-acetylmuramate dehydrogenase [Uliginosibacterium gangwonense]|uniref:UDP-N-acetylmuramate dehydrogenase n=1 Tax=Uliginosibacterium gangwonense TaxID=392736 RepID=UPI000368DDCD|nr:UDP-N-acetylmuramate dehydrogenase [Uliginosibacterium gangwonense]
MPTVFQKDYPLDTLNTLRLPGRARRFAEIVSAGQLVELVRGGGLTGERFFVLGGGSNIVVSGDVDATVLRMCIPGRELVASDDDAHYVRAGAGENWHEFVAWTLEMGWPGLENLALIPGTVGAAPIQNIGAYGLEVGECIHSLEAVDLRSGTLVSFDREACCFAYRDSIFKQDAANRFAVTAVTFRLPKRWLPILRYADLAREMSSRGIVAPRPAQVMEAVIAIRQRKLPDPAVIGNAGSFFKNPVVSVERCKKLLEFNPDMPHYPQPDGHEKIAAGWLIEKCGWKGHADGPVGMYEHQALVLVNMGGALGTDVLRVVASVRRDVVERFGIALEMEPVVL